MVTALIITLFLIQLIMFFVIIILNSKISKFKDLELRQNQLIEEMDNTISVYLLEMKEENDRLIEELKTSKLSSSKPIPSIHTQSTVQKETFGVEKKETTQLTNTSKADEMEAPRVFVPVQRVANAYTKQKANVVVEKELDEVQAELFDKIEEPILAEKEQTFEQKIVALYNEGKTIEEIAKQMQRGKTEIELLIKFHA
jgi:hypothetical protein